MGMAESVADVCRMCVRVHVCYCGLKRVLTLMRIISVKTICSFNVELTSTQTTFM